MFYFSVIDIEFRHSNATSSRFLPHCDLKKLSIDDLFVGNCILKIIWSSKNNVELSLLRNKCSQVENLLWFGAFTVAFKIILGNFMSIEYRHKNVSILPNDYIPRISPKT